MSNKDTRAYMHMWWLENKAYKNRLRRAKRFANGDVLIPVGRRMTELDRVEFAAWLKAARIAKGVTVQWCSKLSGVSRSAWYSYERGEQLPNEVNYLAIIKLLGGYNGNNKHGVSGAENCC